MAKSLPPLSWFRAFEAAARHLSFTLAAEELGFTQSAISQHVRALENRLNCNLFIRGHRSLKLTDAGRLLVPDVAAAMAQLSKGTARFAPEVAGAKLTIATSASVAQWVLSPRLKEFQQLHPNIAIQLVTTIWPDDFASTNADIEIRFGAGDVVGQSAQLLGASKLHIIAAPEIASQFQDALDWGKLTKIPLIQPVGLSTSWQDLAPDGLKPVPSVLVDTHGLAVDLAANGAGVALAHTLITKQAIKNGRVVALPYDPVPAVEGYYLARKAMQNSTVQDIFVHWFLTQCG